MPVGLQIITPPASEPVDLISAQQHMRLDSDYDNDAVLGFITAAREQCENDTKRQFMSATYVLTLDYFPGRAWRCSSGNALPGGWGREQAWEHGRYFQDGWIRIPRPPLQSVTSITYTDTTGAVQTLDPSLYIVDTQNEPGRISPAYGKYWPDTQVVLNAAQITFVAGWASAALVPARAKLATKILAGHWYDNRNATSAGEVKEVPWAVKTLLMGLEVPWVW